MCEIPGSPTSWGAPWQERVQVHALVVSYEMALAEITELRRLEWGVMVIDEGHRLKNPSSRLYRVRAGRASPGRLPAKAPQPPCFYASPRTLGLQSTRGAHQAACRRCGSCSLSETAAFKRL